MKINKKYPQKKSETNHGKIRGVCTKTFVPELLINPGYSKRYQMTAMAMYYNPNVGYKNNLIFNFMNFNENLKKEWREKK